MSNLSSRGAAWNQLTEVIKKRDNYFCQYGMAGCTRDQDLTVDHIIAKANGGEDVEQNLITACRTCNGKKGKKVLVRQSGRNSRWFGSTAEKTEIKD